MIYLVLASEGFYRTIQGLRQLDGRRDHLQLTAVAREVGGVIGVILGLGHNAIGQLRRQVMKQVYSRIHNDV